MLFKAMKAWLTSDTPGDFKRCLSYFDPLSHEPVRYTIASEVALRKKL